MADKKQEQPKNEVAKKSNAEQFVEAVKQKFTAEMSTAIQFDDYHRRLAQHLFLAIDTKLKEFEVKRTEPNKPTYTWDHVDMTKLALASIDRINLGLDAAIPNHIHPIPYLDGRTNKYVLDLRIGYEGIKHYRLESASEENRPKDVRFQLVHENDEFEPLMQDSDNAIESYRFKVPKPFDRGRVVGGFGYLVFDDAIKNKLVTVTKSDFEASKKCAKSMDFWGKYEEAMQYKTVITKVMKHVPIDPKTVYTESISRVEAEEYAEVDHVQANINQSANRKKLSFDEVVDIEPESVTDVPTETGAGEEPEF